MNRFQFVEDHKDAWGVKRLCEVVEVARSSFYAWLAAAAGRAARAAEDAALVARIRVLQDPAQGGDRAYGAPRVTADLNEGTTPGDRVNHKRVGALTLTCSAVQCSAVQCSGEGVQISVHENLQSRVG